MDRGERKAGRQSSDRKKGEEHVKGEGVGGQKNGQGWGSTTNQTGGGACVQCKGLESKEIRNRCGKGDGPKAIGQIKFCEVKGWAGVRGGGLLVGEARKEVVCRRDGENKN